ncbi:MAG: hypothetical protein KAS90_00195 [Candidatus Aenigmarchaeota archaeon]|nr:hypothetical protein [Candidatus Aenigmarchaeota archaeon]
MAHDIQERIQFRMNRKKVLSFFPEGKKIGLRFTDIKDKICLTAPRTTRILNSLIDDGFLEKRKVGKRYLYFSRLTIYRGDFDVWDFMDQIDKTSQKNGRVIKQDVGSISGLCSVLFYGCLPYEKLTPLEREMFFQLTNKFRDTFLELNQLRDSIDYRRLIEKEYKLPDNCKNIMFGEDSGEIDFSALHKIYGDTLWFYIFNHYTELFNYQLSKGYMDIHGLKDLFHILDKTVDAIDVEIEKKGFKAHDFPKTETSKRLSSICFRSLFKLNVNNINENSIGVMITPSPRCLVEYSDQIGWIIKDQIKLWEYWGCTQKEESAQKTDWNAIIQESPNKKKRRELLEIGIIERLFLRHKKLSDIENKNIVNDPVLNEIFDKSDIIKMIEKINDLRSRLMYFYEMKKMGKSLDDLKKTHKWFNEDEIEDFRFIADFVHGFELDSNIFKKSEKIKDAAEKANDLKNSAKIMIDLEKHKSVVLKKLKNRKKCHMY